MSLGRPSRGIAAAGRGGGDDRGAAPLGNLCQSGRRRGGDGSGEYGGPLTGALGLGGFPRHDLPAPPDGLDLNAAVAPPVSQVALAPAPARPSHVCVQELGAHVRTVENAFSDADRMLRAIQGEIQQMREEENEKGRQIRSIVEYAEKERQSRLIRIKQFDHDKELMCGILQGYEQQLQKSSDAFLEYRKMREASGVSSSGVMADERNQILMKQRQLYADRINRFQKLLLATRFAGRADEITMLATRIADLKNELKRLKNDHIQIPDLNNGGPQL